MHVKKLTQIDPDVLQRSMNQFSGLAEQLIKQRNALSADKRVQLDEMLKSLGIANPDQISSSEIQITSMKKRDRAAGIACDWWEVRRDEQTMSETCLSEKTNLAFDSADIITLQTLAIYVQELQTSASGTFILLWFCVTAPWFDKRDHAAYSSSNAVRHLFGRPLRDRSARCPVATENTIWIPNYRFAWKLADLLSEQVGKI